MSYEIDMQEYRTRNKLLEQKAEKQKSPRNQQCSEIAKMVAALQQLAFRSAGRDDLADGK